MNISHSSYSIAELIERFNKDIRVNKEYQRSGDIWPDSAKAYFIDTIIEGYPFPKLYFYQIYDKKLKKPLMEIVDGQQRIMTIIGFRNNEFKLTSSSLNYAGSSFSDLSEEVQDKYLMTVVQVDVILSSEKSQLLEMFRRMNAYTAPLNSAEKRHSKYQGRFKWFVTEIADRIDGVLEEYGVLSPKQMIRMADAEFIAELLIVLDSGIVHKSAQSLENIYKKYNVSFPKEKEYEKVITSFFNLLVTKFSELKKTHMMKSYALYSFFTAYAQISNGIPNGEIDLGVTCSHSDIKYDKTTLEKLLAISYAQEVKDEDGVYGEYVKASLSTTTKANQRKIRSKVIAEIIKS